MSEKKDNNSPNVVLTNEVKITEIDLTMGNWVTLVTKSFLATLLVGGIIGIGLLILGSMIGI
jgi:hypothetical protein